MALFKDTEGNPYSLAAVTCIASDSAETCGEFDPGDNPLPPPSTGDMVYTLPDVGAKYLTTPLVLQQVHLNSGMHAHT
jgi:hypothetical protein